VCSISQFQIKLDFQLSKKFNNGIQQDFTVRDKLIRDFLPVSNEICAIYIDDDVTKNPNEHTSIPNRDFVVYPIKRLPGKEYYQDLHSTNQNRKLIKFFPFGDKMWGVAIMRDFMRE
jgi:hypothetical protein